MTTEPLIQFLSRLLKTKPEQFSADNLEDLKQTIDSCENSPPEKAEEILRDWCNKQPGIKKALRFWESSNREVKKVRPSQANESMRLANNFPELRQEVEEKQSEITNSTKSDSAKPDQNQNND
ncbi:MAG: hypothetical protein F6K54_23680 [Okeania sp. SIO3B5]|uniref:hypothetical protein n=1 Tax=Okeania sp. SIO3B5 TaxID=2607811 RepID=UPI001401845D|nr:hypothetical protein [Okeania sp. SIO3B5]NEO55803.1 hypothetical protein [Okeania sp. SIO3B5]